MYTHVYIIEVAYCVLVCLDVSILKVGKIRGNKGFIIIFVLVCLGVA